MLRLFPSLILSLGLCVTISGCGSDRNSAPVVGRVTSGGQPVSDVIVRFQPAAGSQPGQLEAGMGSFGRTDADGHFTMRFSDNESAGAIIGEHTVIIDELTPPEEENNDAGGLRQTNQSRIPPRWQDGSARFTVTEGSNEANFELLP